MQDCREEPPLSAQSDRKCVYTSLSPGMEGGRVSPGGWGVGGLVPTPSDHLGDGNGSSVHLVLRSALRVSSCSALVGLITDS